MLKQATIKDTSFWDTDRHNKRYKVPSIGLTGVPVRVLYEDTEAGRSMIEALPHKAFKRGGISYPKNCLAGMTYIIFSEFVEEIF